MENRVKFDFEIYFTNGGNLKGEDFRLDISGDTISDKELADYVVADLRLLMVGETKILNKEIITEPHKRKPIVTDDLVQQVAFIKEIDKLKYIQRKTKLFNSDRHENDAEHSWHLAMMTLVLAEHSDKPIDVLKVVKMVLIHDIVEIDAGDTFIYDTLKNHTNTDEERSAAERIFGLLPAAQAAEFIAIWQEFEDGITDEARFAKAMDRFEPLLQNTSNNGGTWAEFDVPYQKVYDKKKAIKEGSATVWNYAENLINESVAKGILNK